MDLFHVLVNIQQFSEHDSIYVERPWTLESEARVIHIKDKATPTAHLENKVYTYFLDIYLVQDLRIDGFKKVLKYLVVFQKVC